MVGSLVKVRELIVLIEADGWVLVRTKGSHRQFQHPTKPGTVTVAGNSGVDVPPGALNSLLKQAGLRKVGELHMRYLVVVEEGPSSFGAYVPDLPGCVAAAATRDEALALIWEAIEFHIEGLRKSGQTIPPPSSTGEVVDIHAA
jgi:predicted RNA binding protein YcfA (HicA-like mRNA interferase family)/predicted RNase H-like HicB family nuclease